MSINHYLNNFIAIFLSSQILQTSLIKYNKQYNWVTDLLDILKQESKDQTRTIILIFSIFINTNTFVISLLAKKITKAIKVLEKALAQKLLTFKEVQSFMRYILYFAKVVKLRWVFMKSLWIFVTSHFQKVRLSKKYHFLLKVQNNLI